jgi:uncharacterized phiE125 gp8 family phage protein
LNPVKQITPSTLEIVTLTEAKAHLKVTSTDEDTLIQSYLNAAVRRCENYRQSVIMSSEWEVYLRQWSANVNLQKYPVTAINSVKYYDTNNNQQTVTPSATTYRLLDFKVPARLEFDNTYSFPSLYNREYPIVINYQAGYTYSASANYALIKEAVFMELGTYNEIRQNEILGVGLAGVQIKNSSMELLDAECLWL